MECADIWGVLGEFFELVYSTNNSHHFGKLWYKCLHQRKVHISGHQEYKLNNNVNNPVFVPTVKHLCHTA